MKAQHLPPIEIMAPVGSWESLMAAVKAGAHSVYFGIGKLNMRSRSAANFNVTDLPQIARICRAHNVLSYVTVNTVVYDGEIAEMHTLIDAVKANELTAIIATDISVIAYARSRGVEVHMSTQTNITNIESVRFWAQFADVMVTARELNLSQVKALIRQIREESICGPSGNLVRIEIFVHGALCMAISGKCYLSLDNYNSSGNRGACLQPCRRPYKVTDRDGETELEIDNEYIMSPKDLATIGILDQIVDAGVRVLKIEGRGRSADYVKTVVEVYREAVEALQKGEYTPDRIREWEDSLNSVYNRGFWTGYYLGQKMGEWTEKYGSQASKRKVYIGKVTNYFKKIGVAEIALETQYLKAGEELVIMGPTTGVYQGMADVLHKDEGEVEEVRKGDVFAVKTTEMVRRSDKVYKLVDAGEILEDYYPKEKKTGLYNYHTHTHYCDGQGSIDDHATHALASGFHSLGFSSHAPLPFENNFSIKEEDLDNYSREVRNAAKRYAGKLDIYLGLEADYIPGISRDFNYWKKEYGLDYLIGGVHLVKPADRDGLWFIDGSKQEIYDDGLKKLFDQDIRRAVGAYFSQVIEMLEKEKPDILAHFDKIKMHNKGRFFSEEEEWYQQWIDKVLDAAQAIDCIVEVNTRGLYKKRSEDFFPSGAIFPKLLERDIRVLVSTDAHAAGEQDLYYRDAVTALKKAGFKELVIREGEGWKSLPISSLRLK
jgi:putative protease